MISYLDPDFRKDPPVGPDGRTTVPYCARCQKAIDPAKTRKAWVNWETWEVSLDREEIQKGHVDSVIEHAWIGNDCWKKIKLPTTSTRGPGQPKKGNVRFTAHITPATHKRILSRQKPGMTLGQVIDSAFEPTHKV